MKNQSQQWSRRKFLTTLGGAGTVMMLNPLLSWTVSEIDPRVAKIVANTIGIDTHNHIDVALNFKESPGSKVDLKGEIKKSGLSAISMTFAVDYQKLKNEGDAYSRFTTGLDEMDRILKDNDIQRSLNLSDLQSYHQKKIPTVIQSVEGGHFLEGKLDRLQIAYERGLRQLGLLHDNNASVPLGDVYTNSPQFGGLTSFGADIIKECNALGILIDLAHANNETINMAIKKTVKPVLISHTGLDSQLGKNEMMAKMMKPRLISKEQAKIVAETGGVIGVWTHLAETPLEYAQNVRALADITGIDHVCIGTDTKLTPAYRSPNEQQPKQNENFTGKKEERVGERTNLAWKNQNEGFYFAVVDALLKTGFTEDEIGKIGGGNYCRVFGNATK
ncbi:dipeptidase [Chryseobacterium sp. JUb7]|uniref:dipeptidase n=1 Tax=Chryseobacterium sp. JUb7 TaxID=2940599 RepID=UPI00216A1EEC|nr:membrane dipeptidase [Chryseobacterium sp. JUb7]MCS3528989.1 membrane dipeptidase [Chryseobacterium sp. JUb7]